MNETLLLRMRDAFGATLTDVDFQRVYRAVHDALSPEYRDSVYVHSARAEFDPSRDARLRGGVLLDAAGTCLAVNFEIM
jgi:hypothetical protein